MLYLMGEVLIYLIIAASLGLLAGWAVTWTSMREKLVHVHKSLQTQLNDRSNAVKQLKETLQAKIQEVEELEYELMRRNVDRPEKLIGQGGTDRVREYEQNIQDELTRRDLRIAELEDRLAHQGDIVIDPSDDYQHALKQRDNIIAELKAALKAQQTPTKTEAEETTASPEQPRVKSPPHVQGKKTSMRQLEADLQAYLNLRQQQGETPELRDKINQIKAAILDELKGKRKTATSH
jgi:hypothetical protein